MGIIYNGFFSLRFHLRGYAGDLETAVMETGGASVPTCTYDLTHVKLLDHFSALQKSCFIVIIKL